LRLGALALPGSAVLSKSASFDFLVSSGLFIAALALSLAHPWSHAYEGQMQFGDAAYWDFNAESWARGYALVKAPDIRPGYSVFLGSIYSLFGPDFRYGFIAHALLYALGVYVLYRLGQRLSGRLVGLTAALLFALDPYMWEWTATSTTDLLGSIVNLGAIYFLATALLARGSKWRMFFFGLLFGFANVIRVFSLAFLGPALLIPLLLRVAWRRRLALISVGFAATILGLLPGAVYQYATTGDPGLSSNTASAIFAASSPRYGVWTPQMYGDVEADMRARGEDTTPQALDAEFRRLTILNYIQYPFFQVRRVVEGMVPYIAFEGELDRPEQYVFYRPAILIVASLVTGAFVAAGAWRRPWALLPAVLLVAGLVYRPVQTLVALQVFAVLAAAWYGIRRRSGRALGMLEVAAYWTSAGFFAVLTAGISGALLNRLYTQVEPARALLLAFGAVQFVHLLSGSRVNALRYRLLRPLVSAQPRLPRLVLRGRQLLVGVAVIAFCAGSARMVAANAAPPPSAPFDAPSADQLQLLATQLGLNLPVTYASTDVFDAVRADLISGVVAQRPRAYALPGQFSRFIWDIDDQQRTISWFVVSGYERPLVLDRNLLLVESLGDLSEQAFRDRNGLLLVVQNSAYDDSIGHVTALNVVTTRAFVPWDATLHTFRFDQTVSFPLDTPLYDHKRFVAAQVSGNVSEAASQQVQTGDRSVRAYSLEAPQPGGTAAVTFGNVYIPGSGAFQAWVSLHPRFFNSASAGTQRVDVRVRDGTGETTVAELLLDPARSDQRTYLSITADLSSFADENVDLTIAVTSSDTSHSTAEVLIGEPRVISQ
jgi:hypothetical protein